ncbi:MAG: hypothetical protein ABIP71_01900, partial [Verrucomicrobiota bacterium]
MTNTGTSVLKDNKLPKTDVRFWRNKLFQRSNGEWHCQIGFGGNQRRWPLKTANKEQAAAKARDIWLSLQTHGFEASKAKFKPWTVAPLETPADQLTIGDFLTAVKAIANVRPTTLTTYIRKFRFLVSQVAKVKGSKARHDYVHGGSVKWQKQIDGVKLSSLTPESIMQWRTNYISKFDDQPLKRGSAQQTAASIIRNAKSLFSPRILPNLGLKLPSPLPFARVDLGKRPRTRYKSKINPALLATLAQTELKVARPEQFKIFLLAFGAGLRRSEIDRLEWKNFDWERGTLAIESSEYGTVKTESSDDQIDIGQDLLDYFKKAKAES